MAARLAALGAALALVGGACAGSDDGSDRATRTGATTAVATTATAPSTTTTTPPTTTTTAPPPPPRTFSIAATGDLLLHVPVQEQARRYGGGATYDFGPMLADIAPEVAAADLALCHLEVPLSADGTGLSGYPMFNGPPQIAAAVAAAGYDGCSTASNHSLDRGLAGVGQTLDVLDAAGLRHAGTARSAEEAASPPIYEVASDDGRPVRVGHLSYAYGFNGIPLPSGAPWAANLLDPARIAADAAALRARGAEVVAVSLQWGAEYQAQPTAEQRAIAAQLLAGPDVDVILGSHVHVVQPIERIGGKVVVYGMGNLLSNQTERAATQDGVVVHLDLVEGPDGRFRVGPIRYTPTWVEHPGYVIRRVSPTSDPASFQRTTAALGLLGGFDGTATTG